MIGSTSFGLSAAALLLSAVNLSAASADAPVADAMEKMDRAAVRALLQRKADINAPQVDGMTALHWAAYQDDLESVELLVRAGANARAANRYGITPLTLAITNGDSAMVEALLKAGADPNTTLPGGETDHPRRSWPARQRRHCEEWRVVLQPVAPRPGPVAAVVR